MNYSIVKLDKRHNWHQIFTYMIEFSKPILWNHKSSGGVLDFDRSRRWFNTTFGWSQDVETRSEIVAALVGSRVAEVDRESDFNQNWAYSCKYNEYRIYIRSDKELNWFVLSHPVSA